MNANGIISIGAPFMDWIPSPFPYLGIPLVAPFWHDVNTEFGGRIYYRQTSNPLLVQQFTSEVKDVTHFDCFAPTALFIATWLRVPPYSFSPKVDKEYISIIPDK